MAQRRQSRSAAHAQRRGARVGGGAGGARVRGGEDEHGQLGLEEPPRVIEREDVVEHGRAVAWVYREPFVTAHQNNGHLRFKMSEEAAVLAKKLRSELDRVLQGKIDAP